MHATLKRVGTVFLTDIQNLERVRVSVWLGVLSLHIEESGGEIVRINFGRLAEIRERAERKPGQTRPPKPAASDANGREPLRAGASNPELRFFESHKITQAAFGGIWQALKPFRRLLEAQG